MSIELETFKLRKEKYFELCDLIDESYYEELSNSDCEKTLDTLLQKSVKKRLLSVGIIGSGGVDSSLIAHYANKYDRYNLLHINSELKYANILAKDLAVDKDLDYKVFKNTFLLGISFSPYKCCRYFKCF